MPSQASGERPASAAPEPSGVELSRLCRLARVDFAPAHRPPASALVALASVVALAGSLVLDAVVVHVAKSLYPATRHFSRFVPSDYVTLTVIGVLVACAAWPAVTRATSSPRWLFFRMAVVVTPVLWLPDGWLLLDGVAPRGVAALMVMHLLVALVTYNALVRLAPVRPTAAAAVPQPGFRRLSERTVRRTWNVMALLTAAELGIGVSTIVVVPFSRSDAVVPAHGTTVYLIHGALGLVLAAGAVVVLVASSAAERLPRIGAVIGAVGVGAGLGGGVAATYHTSRLLGMGLMLIGVLVALMGYLVPTLDAFGKAEARRAGVPPGLGGVGAGPTPAPGASGDGAGRYAPTERR